MVSCLALAAAAKGEGTVGHADFVTFGHMGGSLAVSVAHVESAFLFAPSEGKPARVRLNLPAGDAKTLEGTEAEALWKALHAQAGAFVWVGHMGGTLGIPLAKIQSVYKGANGDLRINYPGDPQGKTVTGAEAASVWATLTQAK